MDQQINELNEKIASQQRMIRLLEEERIQQKKKLAFTMEPDYDQHSIEESYSKVAAKNESVAVSPVQQRYFSSMKPPVPGQRYKSTAMLQAAAGFDRVEESEMSMMYNNVKRTG